MHMRVRDTVQAKFRSANEHQIFKIRNVAGAKRMYEVALSGQAQKA